MKYTTLPLTFLLGIATTAFGQTSQEAVVWIEAEQFAKPGGWVSDPQFVDVMGSPYLLANAIGKPVAVRRLVTPTNQMKLAISNG